MLTAALALFAPAVFTTDPAVRDAAVTGLLWSALTQPLAALAFVYDGIILGLGDYAAMRRAMLIAILAFAPLAALVLRFHWLGLPGVWTALGCWLAARTVLLWRRWAASSAPRSRRRPDFVKNGGRRTGPSGRSPALAAPAVRVRVGGRGGEPAAPLTVLAFRERVSLE